MFLEMICIFEIHVQLWYMICVGWPGETSHHHLPWRWTQS